MDDGTLVLLVLRVATPSKPAFQLRPGEEGLSVFLPHVVDPPLTHEEVLEAFRTGSAIIERTVREITELGLLLVDRIGSESLPDRLRLSHSEIRAGNSMTRNAFKNALNALE